MTATPQFVGIGELKFAKGPQDLLVASNLGSCLGLAAYVPSTGEGGLLHCLLPLSKSDPQKAATRPTMFVDLGVPLLLEPLLKSGVSKNDIILYAAGCANINDEQNVFEIGKKNYTVLRKILWKNGMLIKAEHVGEAFGRTLSLEGGTGRVTVKAQGETVTLG